MAPSPLTPFTPKKRPSGFIWIALNILRLISIVAITLVFVSNIVTMVDDIKAINAFIKSGGSNTGGSLGGDSSYEDDCDYIEYSTVPNQAGGAFWSILSRLFIVFECILLALSECGVPKRFFELFLPVLGPAHGMGVLGALQCLIGAQVLSHYIDLFPQACAWLLFIVGCFNIVVGIISRSSAKRRRLIFSWENVSQLNPQTKAAATAWDMVTDASEKYREYKQSKVVDGEEPLLPPRKESSNPGSKFGGFGFGRQGEKAAGLRGYTISKPVESLPRYATAAPRSAN